MTRQLLVVLMCVCVCVCVLTDFVRVQREFVRVQREKRDFKEAMMTAWRIVDRYHFLSVY